MFCEIFNIYGKRGRKVILKSETAIQMKYDMSQNDYVRCM